MSTGYYLLDNPPTRSQYRTPRRAKPTGCIVLHTAESNYKNGAEPVARFIQRRPTPGSYHMIGGVDRIIPLVPFSYEAWQDGTGSNRWAIGLSLAMEAHTWPDLPMNDRNELVSIIAQMAHQAAEWLRQQHGIIVPAVRITKAESDAGKPGFIPHADRDPTRRTDPGRHFPWTQFFKRYTALQTSTPQEPDMEFQERINAAAVGIGYTSTTDPDQLAANVEDMAQGITKLIADKQLLGDGLALAEEKLDKIRDIAG